MKKDSNDKTVLYSQNDYALDDALKTFEKPLEPAKKKRSFSIKKLFIILSVCVALAAVGTATFFLITGIKRYPCAVVKTADGRYALAGKAEVPLDFDVKEIKPSYKYCAAAFTDTQNNLYAVKTDNCKSSDAAQLIFENFNGEFLIFNGNVICLSDKTLYCYDFKNTERIAENASDIYCCENSEKLIYQTADGKLFSTDGKASQQIAYGVEKVDFYSDGSDMNLLFTANGKLFYCGDDGSASLLSESSDEYFCGEKDEVYDNVYFYEKSSEKKHLNVVFSDELAKSDSEMKEPVSSDYQKSLVFGLIQYVDPAKYKAAYIEYQKKLARDKIREYVNGFDGSAECFKLMCFNSSGISSLDSGVFKEDAVAFAKHGEPRAMFLDSSSQKTVLEVSEIANEMKANEIGSQEDFDKYVFRTARENPSSNAVIFSASISTPFEFDGDEEYDKIEFSKEGETILFEKNGEFSLGKISDNRIEKICDKIKIREHLFENGILFFTDENGELFCIDFINGFEKKSIEKNVMEIKKFSDKLFIKTQNEKGLFDWKSYFNGETDTVAKDCSDFLFVSDENFYYVSQGNVFCIYGDRVFVQNSVSQLIK